MKGLVIYNSKKGHTKKYGEEIGEYLREKKLDTKVLSVAEFKEKDILDADIVFMGSWTNGMFLLFQHPDKKWVDFTRKLPDIKNKKVGLFTTYNVATGSMFKSMERKLKGKISDIMIELKSKTSILTDEERKRIEFVLSE
jgi:flavodoxin